MRVEILQIYSAELPAEEAKTVTRKDGSTFHFEAKPKRTGYVCLVEHEESGSRCNVSFDSLLFIPKLGMIVDVYLPDFLKITEGLQLRQLKAIIRDS